MVCVLLLGLPQADARPAQQKPNKPLVSVTKQPKKDTVGKKAKNAKSVVNAKAGRLSSSKPSHAPKPTMAPPSVMDKDGLAEARLMENVQAHGQCQPQVGVGPSQAAVVIDYPQFQLAQLVYADLMMGRTRPLKRWGMRHPMWRRQAWPIFKRCD